MLAGRFDEAQPFTTLDGSTIREVAGRVSLPAANQSLAEAAVPVGGETLAHLHRTSEEIYAFVRGMGRIRVDGEEAEVQAGDVVVLPPGAEHKLWNTGGEPLVLWCCCAPAYRHEDTVITE